MSYNQTDPIKIDERKLYCEIFFNFENEIRELTQYVSVIPQNYDTSSNKIHELHIRICTELENLLKIVSHEFVASKEEFTKITKKAKNKASKVKLLSDIELLLKKCNIDNIESLISGFLYPDFQIFNIKVKKVEFIGTILNTKGDFPTLIKPLYFQPFFVEDGKVTPNWWTAYNNIKHNKIDNFENCTLNDLMNAFAGFYLIYNFLQNFKSSNQAHCLKESQYILQTIDSKIFKATYCPVNEDLKIKFMPEQITPDQYDEIKPTIEKSLLDPLSSNPSVVFLLELLDEKEYLYIGGYTDFERVIVYNTKVIWMKKYTMIKFLDYNPPNI
jgi:hypothetical protein